MEQEVIWQTTLHLLGVTPILLFVMFISHFCFTAFDTVVLISTASNIFIVTVQVP